MFAYSIIQQIFITEKIQPSVYHEKQSRLTSDVSINSISFLKRKPFLVSNQVTQKCDMETKSKQQEQEANDESREQLHSIQTHDSQSMLEVFNTLQERVKKLEDSNPKLAKQVIQF